MNLREHGRMALRMMLLIREFEQRLKGFADEKLIRGSTHPSVGMEAVAVGVSMALGPNDCIASNHRGHAHCLARGADPGRTLAEIFGRADGYCKGKGGSMHIGVQELGILGTNGIVGAGIGLATGAALAASVSNRNEVAVAYFGDGGSNQGVLAESMNLAAIWKLPVIFVCENNHYAQSSAIERMFAQPQISQRGPAYGVPSVDVDGMDVAAVYDAAEAAVTRARSQGGPTLIVADTYRFLGHMADDTQMYRALVEVDEWRGKCPIDRLANTLTAAGLLSDQERNEMSAEAKREVDDAEHMARQSPVPSAQWAFTDVDTWQAAEGVVA
ncbi:thiamine pyrophosphate-dependent dehydrogenase E1 component subunit alpha [Peristeroidobacter soli]|uniref:thiamine pyrophosphate-dependent dehydrogenase E1 component subunit alpha n=1 Tax=Peristeroidobacter soli TaxID=2497877 RepID=UPI00101DC210|nr:thiamine pyrophosphate-dependent dehydrogenase E1 component subunit alpha [Peristeroidobacter soli]